MERLGNTLVFTALFTFPLGRSFIYDIISGYPPYNQEEIDSVFWRIGSGYTVSLQDINCNTRLKVRQNVERKLPRRLLKIVFLVLPVSFQTVITACWSPNPTERPSFVEVLRRLQPSALLCRSHSCSEPERLNRLGMCRLTCWFSSLSARIERRKNHSSPQTDRYWRQAVLRKEV